MQNNIPVRSSYVALVVGNVYNQHMADLIKRIFRNIRTRWERKPFVIGWDDYIAIGIAFIGIIGFIDGPIPLIPSLTEVYHQIRGELIGIGITVLILGNANEAVKTRQEKERLILQMGSPDNAFAREAVRSLDARGWLRDGSLKNSFLHFANLKEALLLGANLEGADLSHSNLLKANMTGANLKGAILYRANLEGARLYNVNLEEAKLIQSNLKNVYLRLTNLKGANLNIAKLDGANLKDVNFKGANIKLWHLSAASHLNNATMSNGKKYDGRLRLRGDTEDAKKAGVNTDNQDEMTEFYSVSLEDYIAGQKWAKENLPGRRPGRLE